MLKLSIKLEIDYLKYGSQTLRVYSLCKLEAIAFLLKFLQEAGFEIIELENSLTTIDLCDHQLSSGAKSENSNSHEWIFPSNPRLYKVFEFIESNYCRNIKLKEVAQAMGYSSSYLTNLVRRITGKTVNDWIIQRRMTQARYLLSETKYSIEEIGFKIGYQNINHFYHQFRAQHKTTPKAWRETQLKPNYKEIDDSGAEYISGGIAATKFIEGTKNWTFVDIPHQVEVLGLTSYLLRPKGIQAP